jgi:hypothetical protein
MVMRKFTLGEEKERHTCCRLVRCGGWGVVLFLVGFLGGWWVVFVLWWGDGLCCSFCFFLGFCGLALVFPMYTACVLRGALRFH